MAPSSIRRIASEHPDIVERPEFVVVHRDGHVFPGVLFEWRRQRQPDGNFLPSARVIFMDGLNKVQESWFLEASIGPGPFDEP